MSTLTDRYVHAATRYLAPSKRGDIARELASSIDDMVAARVEAGEEPDVAEREVLTDLGNPDVLAAQYADRPMHLIGPRFFAIYLRVTGLILAIVPLLVGAIAAVAKFAADGDVGDVIGAGLGGAFSVAIQVVFWSTLTFALIDRYGSDADVPEWTVDKLPEIAAARQVSLSDTIASVFFIGLVAAILIVQHFRSWVEGSDGQDVPVLDPQLWSFWLPFLIGVLVVSMAVEVYRYKVGHDNWAVVGGVIVTSIAWLVPFAWLAAQDRLLSREFVSALEVGSSTLDQINVTIIVVAIVIEVWAIGDAVVKLSRARSQARA